MSKSESDAMTSGSESESDEEEVPMQTTDDSELSENDSDSASDISDDSEADSDSEHSSSGASDSEVDESTREAAAAAVRAIAEREAQKAKRREMNAKKKAAKAEATAAAAPATPAATAAGASSAVAAAAVSAAPGAAPSTLLNKLIKDLVPDYYYHLGLSSEMDLKAMFGDVRFVLLSGSAVRAAETAVKLVQALGVAVPTGCTLSPIGKTERYSIYKAGPVLSVSHGMGKPSISIMLHELTKMLAAAGVLDKTTYIRIGTSGGVGAEPGTVIVSSGTVNGALEPTFPIIVLGKTIHRPCRIEPKLVSAIMASSGALAAESGFKVVKGLTMATDDFYEGQGRLDGAIAEYTLEDKMAFLRLAHRSGVKNIEMESDCIVAFCTRLNIRCAVVCAAIVNRLNGDQVTSTPEQLVKFTDNAVQVSIRYIQKELGLKPKAAAAGGKAKPPVLAQGQQGKGNKAVPHVAGSGTDFPQCTVGHDHTGAPQTRACAKGPAPASATPAASSKKKKNKPDNQNQAASSKKKDKKGAANGQNQNGKQSQSAKKDKKNNNGPKTPVKGAATAPSTPAASGKKNKNKGPKTPNGAAPATPAAVAAGTPAPLSHAEKVVAAAAAVAAKEAAKAAAAASSKKKKGDTAAATPKKDAAATPAATPAASEKKKKKEKAANGATPAATPAKPAAAPATPGAPATAPLNRREKKRLADEAAAAAKAAAESKAAADAATIAANRASDLLKFDPDAAAFPKVKRPNKNERAAEKQRKALEALAQTNAPAANGAAFATPAKAANGSAPTASATVDGKKRKLEDEPAANGKAAPATEAKKSKKAKKDE